MRRKLEYVIIIDVIRKGYWIQISRLINAAKILMI